MGFVLASGQKACDDGPTKKGALHRTSQFPPQSHQLKHCCFTKSILTSNHTHGSCSCGVMMRAASENQAKTFSRKHSDASTGSWLPATSYKFSPRRGKCCFGSKADKRLGWTLGSSTELAHPKCAQESNKSKGGSSCSTLIAAVQEQSTQAL